jgi:hypothetical protein
MGPRANSKEPFFGSKPTSNAGDGGDDEDDEVDSDIPDLLDYAPVEDTEVRIASGHMTHGVYHNALALSLMFEVTMVAGKVYEFYQAFSSCYDNYVPRYAGTIPFEFPCAATSYRDPKKEEKRLLAANNFEQGPLRLIQQFINKRGHGAIASEKLCTIAGPIDQDLCFLRTRFVAAILQVLSIPISRPCWNVLGLNSMSVCGWPNALSG